MFKLQRHIYRLTACLLAVGFSLLACVTHADDAPAELPDKPGAEKVELPGITIDAKQKRIDVAAKVALDAGLLELVACTRDTKEHESLLIVDAVPMHIHAALLLIGAENGHPAMAKPVNEERTEWLQLPPRGDEIVVSLVYPDPEDTEKTIERPISDFLKRTERDPAPQSEEEVEGPAKVFEMFLFAGSVLIDREDGERTYVADQSGNVISISTFGDEVLCLPAQISQDNEALVWSVNDKYLPAVGTKVKLRLTLKNKPEDKPQ